MEPLVRESLRIVHVAEDNDFTRMSEIMLKGTGFTQPIIRCDGTEAIRYFSMTAPELAPHVILLDLGMAHMDGTKVLHWLRYSYTERNVAVYLLTSSEDPGEESGAAANGETKCLFKPPLFDELLQNLDHLIAIRNNQRQDVMAAQSPQQSIHLNKPPLTGIVQTKRLTISFSMRAQ